MESLQKFIPIKKEPQDKGASIQSPGQMESHYAPWTQFCLMPGDFRDCVRELDGFYDAFRKKKIQWPRVGLLLYGQKDLRKIENDRHCVEKIEYLSRTGDIREAAANLFQTLRKLDKMHLDILIAERLPEVNLGLAIMDRLKKASAGCASFSNYFKEKV